MKDRTVHIVTGKEGYEKYLAIHYKAEYWDLFKLPEFDSSPTTYDGHTPKEALQRLIQYTQLTN